jgi:hypothetical protein
MCALLRSFRTKEVGDRVGLCFRECEETGAVGVRPPSLFESKEGTNLGEGEHPAHRSRRYNTTPASMNMINTIAKEYFYSLE